MKFKVGDIITGKSDERYVLTTTKAIMKVVKVHSSRSIVVEIIRHKDLRRETGKRYDVDPTFFRKIEPSVEILQELVLNELIKQKLPQRINAYEIFWENDYLQVGCQKIKKADALKIANAIKTFYNET